VPRQHLVEAIEQHQLIAARHDRDPRLPKHRERCRAYGREGAQMRGPQRRATPEQHRVGRNVLAAWADIAAPLYIAITRDAHRGFTPVRILEANDRVGAGRQRGARHDAHGRSLLHPWQAGGIAAGHAGADHRQDTR